MVSDVEARLALLSLPRMRPLECWRGTLAPNRPVPHFDPHDGGTDARLLILLETAEVVLWGRGAR